MVLAEHLGPRADDFNVKIYATDVDEEALATARHGVYRVEDVKDVPTSFMTAHFVRDGQTYRFRRDLRRWCIFGRHNVAQDPPISHIDLLVCRNVLIYFTAELQERILARFRYALRDDGYLFLGRAESLLARSRWFTPVHVKWRVLQRTTAPAPIAAAIPTRLDHGAETRAADNRPVGLRLQPLLQALPSAVMFIDAADTVLVWNPAAEALFELAEDSAVGRKFRDMPRTAIMEDDVDAVLSLDELARALTALAAGEPFDTADARGAGRLAPLTRHPPRFLTRWHRVG